MKHQYVFCPICHSSNLKVVSTDRDRPTNNIIRRRACQEPDCGYRWWAEQPPERIIDRDRLTYSPRYGYQLVDA